MPTKRAVLPPLKSALLALCLMYIGGTWIFSPSAPQLTEVLLKVPLSDDALVYGVKDDRGGATVPLSYRYYVYRTLGSDEEILSELKAASPFLVTRDDSIAVDVRSTTVSVTVDREVYEFHSQTLYRHANGTDYTPVNINLCSQLPDNHRLRRPEKLDHRS